jgi:hypothetical protein
MRIQVPYTPIQSALATFKSALRRVKQSLFETILMPEFPVTKRRNVPPIAVGMALLALQGCSSMYSPARDKQGQAAKASWGQVKLEKEPDRVTANLNTLFEDQLKTVDESAGVSRDAQVQALATLHTVEDENGQLRPATLRDAVIRIQRMGGITSAAYPCKDVAGKWCSFSGAYPEWQRALSAERATEESYRAARINAARFRVQLPADCTTLLAKHADVAKLFNGNPGMSAAVGGPRGFAAVKEICDNQAQAVLAQQTLGGNFAWAQARDEALRARKALEDARDKTATAREHAKAAKAEIAAEEDAGRSNSEALKNASVNLKNAVGFINQAGDIFSAEFIAEEKQDSLNAFFQAIDKAEADKDPAAGTGRAASALILFADFFDKNTARFKPSESASLTGLTLQRRLAAVEQASYAKAIAGLERRVKLKEQRAALLKEQLERVMAADMMLSKSTSEQLGMPFMALVAPKDPKPGAPGNEDVWLGMAYYLDANIRMQAVHTKLMLQLNAQERIENVDVAGANLTSWKTLVDANVEQLSAWASEGIRNEDIAAVFDAVAKLAIAIGVNK